MEERFGIGLEVDSYLDNMDYMVLEYWGIEPKSRDPSAKEVEYRQVLAGTAASMIRMAMQLRRKPHQQVRELLDAFPS